MFSVKLTNRAIIDTKKLKHSHLDNKVKQLIEVIRHNPYQNPPPYEKLQNDLKGSYSRRINQQHRLVYSVDETSKQVIISAMWTHYE